MGLSTVEWIPQTGMYIERRGAVLRVLLSGFMLLGGLVGAEPGVPSLTDAEKSGLMVLARETLVKALRGDAAPLNTSALPESLTRISPEAFVVLRRDGICRGCWSGRGQNLVQNVTDAVRRTLKDERYGGPLRPDEMDGTRIEILILGDRAELPGRSLTALGSTIRLGVDTIQIVKGTSQATFLSYVPVTYDYSLARLLDRLCVKAGLAKEAKPPDPKAKPGAIARSVLQNPDVRLYRTPTLHLLESPERGKAIDLFRCNVIVPVETLTRKSVEESIHLCGEHLLSSMGWTGRLEYLWWPVASRYSQGNNPVRQWMATNALWDLYRYTGQDRYRAAARRNLAYNLRTFYRDVPGEDMGAIFYENTAKLGAAAFALTAVLHIDEEGRERPTLERLKKFILSMQENDGSFRSLYPPGGHDPEQSRVLQRYYAGEALLALVTLHEREPDPKLLDAVRKAFPYYREFVRTDAHPASVPWLTQAYVRAHRLEKNREYAEFVFRISDFVAGIQEAWTEAAPDEQGTFYDPERPEHGPPLSASTGVYVEGLVDAYRLAKDYNDAERQKRYRKAIVQGIRSLIQLQFRGDNLFFVKEPERTRGGIRASVTESSIRIDYTQHAAQAMIQAVQALDDWPGSLDRPAVGRP